MADLQKRRALERLEARILSDNLTPDLSNTASQLVFGEGSIDADVIFVGEAPGKKEDETGLPFVGAAGKMLDSLLESITLDRASVYITNIVKYRPPENRDPLPEEKTAMWPYLLEQISIIKPKIIVTLGRHSGHAFIPGLRISADHGKLVTTTITEDGKDTELKVLPLYHPAAALYNGGLRQTLFDDIAVLPSLIATG